MGGMCPHVARQIAIEFLAADLMRKDEQLFRWLLESDAARKLYERAETEANLHPSHPTLN
jgi:hypothetical protein